MKPRLAVLVLLVWAAACASRQSESQGQPFLCTTDAEAFLKSMGGAQP